LIFPPFFHHLHFFQFSPSQKIRHLIFFLFHIIFDFSSFAFKKNQKFHKELKRTLEKRKGKVAFHFFAFGQWDKPALWLPYKRAGLGCLLLSSLKHLSF
jgi:hypothetical protein